MADRVNPIRITDKDTGDVYELDFSRDSVKFAEDRGFKLADVADFPATNIPELFFYAFRMHHKNKSRQQTDALLEKMHGLTRPILMRLGELFTQAQTSNNLQDEEDLEGNAAVTVEL